MFVGVISNVQKELNKSETEAISSRSVVHLTVTTKSVHSRCNLFVRKCADRSHYRLHYTQFNHLHTIPSIVGGTLQSREHTFVR
jgi:hypothetical protein